MPDGAAAGTHSTEPWKRTRTQPYSVGEALTLARSHGVAIPDFLDFNVREDFVPKDAHASYSVLGRSKAGSVICWTDLLNRFGKIPIHLREDVLLSDEAVVAVFGHEAFELTRLSELFAANGGAMTVERLHSLISADVDGNVHSEAVAFADQLVRVMRGS